MGSEYFINSQNLEDKIRKLLPSQGGAGAGFDLSASTQIIPVIDLTESAQGSNLREDLQTAADNATANSTAANSTVTAISNTGFYKVNVEVASTTSGNCSIDIYDGVSAQTIRSYFGYSSLSRYAQDDFVVFLSAGLSMRIVSSASTSVIKVHTRQIASIDGTLTDPLGF
jgi:hypothetical protein